MALSGSLSIASKTETSVTVKWSANTTIKTLKYSYRLIGELDPHHATTVTVNAKSGSFTVTGLDANTEYVIFVTLRITGEDWIDAINATTYNWPTATCPTVAIYNQRLNITLTNPLKRSCTVAVLVGGTQVATASNVTTSYQFGTGLTAEFLNRIPNSMWETYTVQVTYNGHTTTQTGTYTAEGANPIISSVSYADTRESVQAIVGDASKILQNLSYVDFTIESSALYGASIRLKEVTILGITKMGSPYTNVLYYGAINAASDVVATITATDTRGNTATTTKTVTMIGYENPSALITLNRHNNYYSETDLTVDASVSYVGTNTETITAKYRENGTSTWYNWDGQATLSDNTLYTQSLDNTKVWDVQITITDSFGVTTTENRTVGIGLPILYIDRGMRSISMNSFPTEDAQFVVNNVDVMHELFYRAGDTFTLTGYTPIHGFVTLGNKLVRLTIPLPKSLENISTITCTACTGGVRVTAGGYLNNGSDSSNWINDSTVTVTAYKAGDKLIRLELSTSGTYSNVTNNAPVIMACNPVTLSFS